MNDSAAIADLERRRRGLRLPYVVRQSLEQGLRQLDRPLAHAWTLPASTVHSELAHYRSKQEALQLEELRPYALSGITKRHAEEVALRVSAGLTFAELGAKADPLIKPILLYYACAHLCGVYTRAFLYWRGDARAHGIQCTNGGASVATTTVRFGTKGQFPRLAITLFLMTGGLSPFLPLVTFANKPSGHIGQDELLSAFGKVEQGAPLAALDLSALLAFDSEKHLSSFRARHGFHKTSWNSTTPFLLDVAALFVASHLARYDVIGWKQVLEGKDNDFNIGFEGAFERFLGFGIDALLRCLEDPICGIGRGLMPSRESPY